ncbi:hypothetical protein ACEQPO_05355 [Bacillus sp. SL00103]
MEINCHFLYDRKRWGVAIEKWFLQVFLTALITMWIQAGLDQANIIHITNVWNDASGWILIFFVIYALFEWTAHIFSKTENRSSLNISFIEMFFLETLVRVHE